MQPVPKKNVAPKLSAEAQKNEEIQICRELQDREANVFLDTRENQYLMPNELKELEGREWLGTHHINGALAMLRLVCLLFFVWLDSKVQQMSFLHQFF